MSIVPGGLVFKRLYNAVKTATGKADVFMIDNELLLSFDGVGSNAADFVSYGPDALVTSIVQTTPYDFFGMDAGNPGEQLFDNNSFRLFRNNVGSQYLQLINNNFPFTQTGNMCVEFWARIRPGVTGTVAPRVLRLEFGAAPGVFTNGTITFQMNNVANTMQLVAAASLSAPVVRDQWSYYCAQYLGATGRVYYSADGAAIGNTALSMSWAGINRCRMQIGNGAGIFDIRLSNFRVSNINRYGSAPAPVPTLPFPLRRS